MAEYIEREALIDALQAYQYDAGKDGFGIMVVIGVQPAADVAPVVRCWECQHRETTDCPMCHEEYYVDEDDGGDYYLVDRAVDPNGFCSAGERKDGE